MLCQKLKIMKENTVILTLDRYNELVNAERNLNIKTILLESGPMYSYTCYTDDEATEKLAKDLKEVASKCKKAEFELRRKESFFKKLSIFQFMKWKKSIKKSDILEI